LKLATSDARTTEIEAVLAQGRGSLLVSPKVPPSPGRARDPKELQAIRSTTENGHYFYFLCHFPT
jgi:hypothetical protein